MTETSRTFLFLQGPHGPWFHRLGRMLRAAGARVWRVGFNLGDRVAWPGPGYLPFKAAHDQWPSTCAELMTQYGITDLVLYGDTRPIHAEAIRIARARGITVHVFEEGYLRPYWVTYERGGSNGHSRLMDLTVPDMQGALAKVDLDLPEVPATWGDMREHMFWGALYHGCVALGFRAYANFIPHRTLTVGQEFQLYLKRFLLMPLHRLERGRVGDQQRGHATHRQPHQHLVASNHTECGAQSTRDTALAGGGDQCEIARPRDGQKDDDGSNECAVICNAKHEESPRKRQRGEGTSLRHTHPARCRIHTMQRSATSPGTCNGST